MQVPWEQVKELFEAALKQAPADRSGFLGQACAANHLLRAEVESLLAANEDAESFLEKPSWWDSGLEWLRREPADPLVNRRVGVYRILRRIARGGMADVYLGIRADRLYRKFVAIKMLNTGLDNEEVRRRYYTELQTLAVLDHPNIVKLLDGGTTEDGQPYLVMDYIQGVRIDEYFDRHRFSITERLDLFRTVCAAVQHAHQNLIVHRDLKPGNILVTAEGVPKLLDFGIAKLLKSELTALAGLTAPGRHAMTPEYASPEQVLGEPVTTASDVYALGVLLYRLLTGHSPYRLNTDSALELENAICELEPEPPSAAVNRLEEAGGSNGFAATLTPESVSAPREGTPEKLRRRLEGELDLIIMMALRKEPQRRYALVEQFSEDIRRHLEGLPVIACKDTLRYRATKFIRRHWVGVAAAALMLLTLVAGVATTTWQTRIAQDERAKAVRRLDDLHKLAGFVLFDLDDAIRSGPTAARKKMVATALVYLNRLADEAGDDHSLRRTLVNGYLRMGDVQGNIYTSNLGDLDGARESYRKAMQSAEELNRANPQSTGDQRLVARAAQKLGELLSIEGDQSLALEHYVRARDIFRRQTIADPANLQAKRDLRDLWEKIGFAQFRINDLGSAQQSYDQCLAIANELKARNPNSQEARIAQARVEEKIGRVLVQRGQVNDGLRKIRRSLEILQQLSAADPEDAALRRLVFALETAHGQILSSVGRNGEALAIYRSGVPNMEAEVRRDPQNRQYQRDLGLRFAFMSELLEKTRDRPGAVRMANQALGVLKKLAESAEASSYDHGNYAWALLNTPGAGSSNPDAALHHARRAVVLTNSASPHALDTLALAHAAAGEIEQAVAAAQKAIALLPAVNSRDRQEMEGHLAKFRATLARK